MSTREEFVENLKRNIDIWNGEIAKMEKKVADAQAASREEYKKQFEKAKALREEARQKISDAQDASSHEWEQMRGRMESAIDDISQGFRSAWSRFN